MNSALFRSNKIPDEFKTYSMRPIARALPNSNAMEVEVVEDEGGEISNHENSPNYSDMTSSLTRDSYKNYRGINR
jgi:hypothetical protein